MRNRHWTIRFAVYIVLLLCTAWGSILGFSRFALYLGEVADRTWVPDTQVQHLMQYHGTDVLKITRDEVYIFRGSKWIPVLKRVHG
jgi:hypothetical protein